MNIWITRTEPGAGRTAERLRGLGHTPLIAPVLEVRPVQAEIDLGGVGALAFSSANGVQAFAALSPDRGLPVFAVGETTAQAAHVAGFRTVISANGDVDALARTIVAAEGRLAGAILHPGAKQAAGDLVGALKARGVAAKAVTVYETHALPVAIPKGAEGLLIHSPKAAAAVAGARIGALKAYCISRAAADPLVGRALSVAVAAEPNETSLLALIGA